jgi:hypothetical protein
MMNGFPGQSGGGRGLMSGVPKNTTIKGQDHELIYANGPEIELLQKRGGGKNPDGSQVMGPRGVRAFPAPGDGAGNDNGAGSESSGGSTGGGEAGSSSGGPAGGQGYGGGPGGVGNTDAEADVAEAEAAAAAAGRGHGTAGSQADAQAAENAAQGQDPGMSGSDVAQMAIKAFTRFGTLPAIEEKAKSMVAAARAAGVDVATGRDPGFSGTGTGDMPGDNTAGGGDTVVDPMEQSATTTAATATRTDEQPTYTGNGLLQANSQRIGPNGLLI